MSEPGFTGFIDGQDWSLMFQGANLGLGCLDGSLCVDDCMMRNELRDYERVCLNQDYERVCLNQDLQDL